VVRSSLKWGRRTKREKNQEEMIPEAPYNLDAFRIREELIKKPKKYDLRRVWCG